MGFPRAPTSVPLSTGKKEIVRIWANSIAARPDNLLLNLACMAKSNAIFAVSEICKGLAIFTIGDMVIADGVGEFICIAALTINALPSPLRRRTSAHVNRTTPSAGELIHGKIVCVDDLRGVEFGLQYRLRRGDERQ